MRTSRATILGVAATALLSLSALAQLAARPGGGAVSPIAWPGNALPPREAPS